MKRNGVIEIFRNGQSILNIRIELDLELVDVYFKYTSSEVRIFRA